VTSGAEWRDPRGWSTGDPCIQTWDNITCDDGDITRIILKDQRLEGSIDQLDFTVFSRLQYIDLSSNNLHGQPPRWLAQRCTQERDQLTCHGLPPDDCSAFGPNSRKSISDELQCVPCMYSKELIALMLASVALIFGVLFMLYAYLVHRFPFFRSWIATSSIFVHHVSSAMLLGSQMAVSQRVQPDSKPTPDSNI
jgi:hypothetical protein